MSQRRRLAVLRPAPGGAATAAHIHTLGLAPLLLPLFRIVPLDGAVPTDQRFDAVVLTSVNAVRHGSALLSRLPPLPVWAVGPATARSAVASGLTVAYVGDGGAETLLDTAQRAGVRRALWIGGRDRRVDAHPVVVQAVAVYASEPLPVSAAQAQTLKDSVALVHSPRSGSALRSLIDTHTIDPLRIRIAAISQAALSAAGAGWSATGIAARPTDVALVAAAARLAD